MAASSPWGNVSAPVIPRSFQDVMSEDLAEQINQEELKEAIPELEAHAGARSRTSNPSSSPPPAPTAAAAAVTPTAVAPAAGAAVSVLPEELHHPQDTTDDLLLAQMLQAEFDKEHDYSVKKKEQQVNGQSKVSLSFQNYCHTHPASREAEEDMGSEDEEYWEEGQYVRDPGPKFKRGGVSGKGSSMVTKHNADLCDRRNATKVYDKFLPGLNIGDSRGMDMKLSNKVFNKLKGFGQAEEKKGNRVHDKKEHATAAFAMDERTTLLLYKLVNAEILEGVSGIVCTGKEAAVLHATGGSAVVNGSKVPSEVAIKVFKTTLTDFKNRADYVKGDVRFFKDEFKKQNPRRIMQIWAQKEEYNLKRLAKQNIPVPKVVVLRKHVLVMSFIGQNQVAAPKLKDAKMSLVDYELAYDQVKKILKTMYHECILVHADLSEYNLLWHGGALVVIDVSQAVDLMHPHAHEFLLRDCRNMTQFFSKAGVAEVGNEYDLFNEVTELGLTGQDDFLKQIQEYEKNEEKLRTGKGQNDFAFDFFFEHSQRVGDEEKDTSDSEEEEEEEEEAVLADMIDNL